MEKRWVIKTHDHVRCREFAAVMGVSPLAAALMIARGFDTPELAHEFLDPSMSHLHEPMLLKGMGEAVERLQRAIDAGERVMIWGDYDVDGTTGTTLLRRTLAILGCDNSEFYIPNRFSEGYGLNIPALEAAIERGVSLVITVDCGIRSFGPLEFAASRGLDVIVTDHHLSDETKGNPPAFAVVNPNQPGCEYPDKHLAGVGVAFKLAHALLRQNGKEHLVPAFLKVAAIGTVADIMKLTGENRAIVALGLRDISNTTNHGLRALIDVAECRAEMTSYHIGFRIAPRINAAGRMDAANEIVKLFEADSPESARELALRLDSQNKERQRVQQEITERAFLEAENISACKFVVVAGEGWHRGVIGLAASRIAERLYRPTIVLSTDNGLAHGSARTVGSFHLLNALDSCRDLFEQFGGHAAAAGMTIKTENIDPLRLALEDYCRDELTDLVPELNIDARVSTQTLGLNLVEDIAKFEPFGAGNPRPVFVTDGLTLREPPFVMKEKHLKLQLQDAGNKRFEAVWWDGVDRSNGRTLDRGSCIEVAYTAEANVWQGESRLQLVVQDLREDNR